MISLVSQYRSVAELLREHAMSVTEFAQRTGLDERVAAAIAYQRYTPSPRQRDLVAQVLHYPCNRIIWGHVQVVDTTVHSRL